MTDVPDFDNALLLVSSSWWRFDSYECDGRYIRPSPEAALVEYNPWEEYAPGLELIRRGKKIRKREFEPPYVRLTDMIERLPFDPNSEGEAAAMLDDGRAILAKWCSSHGLLGLLPQRTVSVVLPARRRGRGQIQERFDWTAEGWRAMEITAGPRPASHRQEMRVARPAPPPIYEPHLVVRRDDSQGVAVEFFETAWDPFFPDQRRGAKRPIPLPLSEAFWRTYAEPVDAFLDAARDLRRALSRLADLRDARVGSDDDPEHVRRLETRRLNRFLSPLGVAVQAVGAPYGRWRLSQHWAAPSLLSTYAVMGLLDLMEKRVRACALCGRVFATTSYQGAYCSKAHADVARQRRKRARTNPPDDKTGE